MTRDTQRTPAPAPPSAPGEDSRQRSIVFALLAAVAVLDQATKWWAFRHVPWAFVNVGGDRLVGHTVDVWYTDPLTGSLLDVLGIGLVCLAVTVLTRRRRPTLVLLSGALMVGGWTSNLLDRLGMHNVTAPGSLRGAVDFLPIGHYFYNLADLFIVGSTPVFLLAIACLGWQAADRPSGPRYRRSRVRIPAFAGFVGVMAIFAIGAATG